MVNSTFISQMDKKRYSNVSQLKVMVKQLKFITVKAISDMVVVETVQNTEQ